MSTEAFSVEAFLDSIEAACEAEDRSVLTRLSRLAFDQKNITAQALVRHADNYLIALKQGNKVLEEVSRDAFLKLVPEIRRQT